MNISIKKGILALLLLPFCLQLSAQNVEYNVAKDIATRFLATKKANSSLVVSNEHTTRNADGEALLYIFNFEGGGFVIVSADRNANPVLAYSPVNSFVVGENPAAESMVDVYALNISYLKEVKAEPSPALASVWDKAVVGDFSVKKEKANNAIVGPLLTSQWDQSKYYNTLCPEDTAKTYPNVAGSLTYDGHVPNGCVAVAMAQIMYYHRYPATSISSSYSYTPKTYPKYGLQTAKANTKYDYEAMSDVATGYSNAIAVLCWHAGISVSMDYGPGGSGAVSATVVGALNSKFKYKLPSMKVKTISNTKPDPTWEATIIDEIDKSLPIYYTANSTLGGTHANHAFVCDGYDNTGSLTYFHFNFGWGGSSDGWYTIDSICYPDYLYINNNTMIIGIEPQSPTALSTGNQTLTATYGSFTDGSLPTTNYADNTNRSWLISPQNGRNISKIKLETAYFDLEDGDTVTIYSGNSAAGAVVAVLSGSLGKTAVAVPTSEAFVTFKSNNDGKTASGFKFTYTSDRSKSTFSCSDNEVAPSSAIKVPGTIDPTNGAKYDDEGSCYWALKADAGKYVGITFTRFDLAEGDYVEINKWNGSASLSVVKFPTHKGWRFTKDNPPILNNIYVVWDEPMNNVGASVRFRADNNLHGTGFTLKWDMYDVGVKEVSAGIENVLVYPNPASDKVKIQLETTQPETLQLDLYDIFGRAIYNISVSEATQQYTQDLDVSFLAKGIYMLKIATSKGQITRKIVVQ